MIVHCGRCQRDIEGSKSEHFTAGYYEVTPGGCWGGYSNPGENILCDCCMWCDPRYIADYYHVEHEVPK